MLQLISLARMASPLTRGGRLVGPMAIVCAVLAGCASASDVKPADKPGTFTVSASATGGRLAWARAHRRAMDKATDYCEHRGLQPSFADEQTAGGEALQQHEAVVKFECHPKF